LCLQFPDCIFQRGSKEPSSIPFDEEKGPVVVVGRGGLEIIVDLGVIDVEWGDISAEDKPQELLYGLRYR
jgi:hypothetical protein